MMTLYHLSNVCSWHHHRRHDGPISGPENDDVDLSPRHLSLSLGSNRDGGEYPDRSENFDRQYL